MLRHPGDWTVVCCSIPRLDPVRAWKFYAACEDLGAFGRVLPYTESGPGDPLVNLDGLDLGGFDLVVTHNEAGEYGHVHHQQVHEFVKSTYPGPIVTFGYGSESNYRIELTDAEGLKKGTALRRYNHWTRYGGGLTRKHDALSHRYYEVEGIDPRIDTYRLPAV